MRLLRPRAAGLALALCVLAVALAGSTSAHPPQRPDHAVDAATFHTLWSGDADRGDVDAEVTGSAAEIRALAVATDVPLDAPPTAVERWNLGDHREFPRTDAGRSIHPPGANLRSGAHIRDAYAAVFAVQPSTRTLVTPGDRPLHVARRGELLGTVDYRVHVPGDYRGPNRTVEWRLRDHRIIATRLLADGRVVARGGGTHTPRLGYAFGAVDDDLVRLTLEADVRAVVVGRVLTCGAPDNESGCLRWNTSWTRRTETLTVRETVDVVPYALEVNGVYGRYPDGDLGVVLYTNRPWLGYAVPGGAVHGVWRFYAARDARWDALVTRTTAGTSTSHSSLHPLQVHAFPIEPGPTASPGDRVRILEAYGLRTEAPALPEHVALDTIEGTYTQSLGIATRTQAGPASEWSVRARGLVRGSSVDVSPDALEAIPIHESDLALEVLETTPETVTVRVTLRDAETGAAINTLASEGFVVLDGRRLETDASGSVTWTVPRPVGVLTARYAPGPWWLAEVGHMGAATSIYVGGTVLHALAALYELGVPVGLFLIGVFIIDRFTGWGVWPPWRGL